MNTRIVLCVDDDSEDREIIRDLFLEEDTSWKVVEAANGQEALTYLGTKSNKQHPPSLILLDLNMPVLDGRETLSILKSKPETASIPVVVFTTSNFNYDMDFCKKYGVEMVTKPLTIRESQEVIRTIMGSLQKDANNKLPS
jgi:CheY-like chemotaxis protein